MNMVIKSKKGFTLVELIVVITILAILGTIAFIALQGYSSQARDSKRLSDVQNIKKSLELLSLNTGKYPLPDSGQVISYSGEIVWTQGTVGDVVTTNLSRNLGEKPTDPLTSGEYTYSTVESQTQYELLSIYESDLIGYNNLLNRSNADANYTKVSGNYDGLYVKTTNYYIPTPSLLTSEDVSSGLVLNSSTIQSQIINGGSNIPAEGINVGITEQLTGLSFQPHYGTITNESTVEEKKALAQSIQAAYQNEPILSNKDIYKTILETADNDLDELIDSVVLKNISNVIGGGESNCIDITNNMVGLWHLDDNNLNDSALSNNGIAFGGLDCTSNEGKIGTACQFDGDDDYIEVADHDSLDITSDFTISFWLKPFGLGNSGDRLIMINKGHYDNWSYESNYDIRTYNASDRNIWSGVGDGSNFNSVHSGNFNIGDWNHILFTVEMNTPDNKDFKLYLNGQLLGTHEFNSTPLVNNDSLYFGGGGSYGSNLIMDEIVIYKESLSSSEIQEIYNGGLEGKAICNP